MDEELPSPHGGVLQWHPGDRYFKRSKLPSPHGGVLQYIVKITLDP